MELVKNLNRLKKQQQLDFLSTEIPKNFLSIVGLWKFDIVSGKECCVTRLFQI